VKKKKTKKVPKKKSVTLYDVNRNPIQVPADNVKDYIEMGFKKEQTPAQAVDPLDTAKGRFEARRPKED